MAYSDQFPVRGAAQGRQPISAALLDPRFLRDVVSRHYRRIGAIAIVAFLLLAAIIVLIGPRYSAVAVVLVDPRQQRVVQSDVVLSGIGNDMAAVDSQVEVIQSTPIALKVISELKLDDDSEFAPSSNPVTALLRNLLGSRAEDRTQYVLSRFANSLKVRRRGLTYVLEIEFISRVPEKAAKIANAVADAYVAQQAAAKASATSEASNWLGDRLSVLRKQATDAEAAVARYKEEKNLVNTGERRSLIEQQLSDINQQLVLANVRVGEIKSRLGQIEKARSDPARNALIDALQSPVVAGLRAQYALAAKTAGDLAQSLGPRHPAYKTSQAELEALNRQIENEIGRLSLGVRNELEAAQTRQRSLEASLEQLRKATASNDQSTVRLHELERESEAAQAILQRSLARYKETREQEGLQTADVRILSPAPVPLTVNGLNRKLLLAIAALGSLLLGLGFTIAGEMIGPVVASRKVVPSSPRLPVLGMLPNVGAVAAERATGLWKPRRSAADPGTDALKGFGLNSPFSPFSEAIRRLAAGFTQAHPRRPYVIAVTGAEPGVGASTVAAAFADALARTGIATLLLDAAVRGTESTRSIGLIQLAQAAFPIDFAVQKRPAGADLITSGAADAAELTRLIDGAPFGAILGKLRGKYHVIVIDSGAAATDPRSRRLVECSDSAIVVANQASSRRIGATLGKSEKFDGIVINRVDLDSYQSHRQGQVETVTADHGVARAAG